MPHGSDGAVAFPGSSPVRDSRRFMKSKYPTGGCPRYIYLMLLCLLSGLLLLACDGTVQNITPQNDFVLGDNDYQLTCDPSGDDETALACQLAYYANRERAAHPEESDYAQPLNWNNQLAAVGAQYSQEMCDLDFFDHTDPSGRRMEDRLSQAGLYWVKAGENLARGKDLFPNQADRMFMDEPACEINHRGNILDNDFVSVGVGVVFCGDEIIYTQYFATFDEHDLRNDPNEYCSAP